MLGTQRASEHSEVLREDVDVAAVDAATAGDDAVARGARGVHAEVGAAVSDEGIEFSEGGGVEEEGEALASGELTFGVLGGDAGGATADKGGGRGGRGDER